MTVTLEPVYYFYDSLRLRFYVAINRYTPSVYFLPRHAPCHIGTVVGTIFRSKSINKLSGIYKAGLQSFRGMVIFPKTKTKQNMSVLESNAVIHPCQLTKKSGCSKSGLLQKLLSSLENQTELMIDFTSLKSCLNPMGIEETQEGEDASEDKVY